MDYYDDSDEEWVDDDSELEDDLLQCPSCRAAVHEDTQQCPQCGDWIVPVYPESRFKRLVWGVAALFAIVALIMLAVR